MALAPVLRPRGDVPVEHNWIGSALERAVASGWLVLVAAKPLSGATSVLYPGALSRHYPRHYMQWKKALVITDVRPASIALHADAVGPAGQVAICEERPEITSMGAVAESADALLTGS